MNWQPPDPPEFGNCLTCNAVIDESEVRGERCIECIDDVQRQLDVLLRELVINFGWLIGFFYLSVFLMMQWR